MTERGESVLTREEGAAARDCLLCWLGKMLEYGALPVLMVCVKPDGKDVAFAVPFDAMPLDDQIELVEGTLSSMKARAHLLSRPDPHPPTHH